MGEFLTISVSQVQLSLMRSLHCHRVLWILPAAITPLPITQPQRLMARRLTGICLGELWRDIETSDRCPKIRKSTPTCPSPRPLVRCSLAQIPHRPSSQKTHRHSHSPPPPKTPTARFQSSRTHRRKFLPIHPLPTATQRFRTHPYHRSSIWSFALTKITKPGWCL